MTLDSSTTIPRFISVDDHVVETDDIWRERLPASTRDRAPRLVRERGVAVGRQIIGRERSSESMQWTPTTDGKWADVWYYEDLVKPIVQSFAASGSDIKSVDHEPLTLDDVRPGCWDQARRLEDMDLNHTDVSICFPNILPRFCGQTFAEAADKDLALLCVRAYNDWMIDEWCAGAGRGRLIPMTIVPLWDVQLAAAEVRRCADKGSFAISFSEQPEKLGLPSVYKQQWDPLFQACADTDTIVCMHIGSSSAMPVTSPDAPYGAKSIIVFQNGMHSMIDYVVSGVLARFPALRIAYSEAEVGWMPFVLDKMDSLWRRRSNETEYGLMVDRLPSEYVREQVVGCIIDDAVGLRMRDKIGISQICYETDYPHSASLFPDSLKIAADLFTECGLTEEEIYLIVRGNAIAAFGLQRFGVTE